ncbi:cell Wall Hydrolase family protein [Butyrivibrio sp. CAG:318]|nr:cell Wall Hydrolase family protein [Butyrivibrio sp. CAG:318]
MRFKSRKASVAVVMLLLMVVQIVFAGIGSSKTRTTVVAGNSEPAQEQKLAASDTTDAAAVTEESTAPITEEEVVSADLNVVYRSTLTSTAVVDEFESSIDNSDYSNKIISYTNERLCMYAEPEYTSDVVGVMYSGTEADIVKRGSEWTEVTSGGVTGYIKNTDVLFGEEAQKLAETIGDKEAVAKSDGLVVYSEASASSSQVAELSKGESVGAYEECDGYVMISHEGGYGYVKADGVSISYGLDSAISIEEEKKRQAEEAAAAAKKAAEEAAAKAAAAAKEKYASVSTTARSSYSASADEIHLLAAIVYWESGWEPANGQLAVANVVLNRVLSSRFSQNTIASVIYAPGQFSGVAENGAPSARFQAVLNMSNEQLNQRGCYDAAVTALSGQNNIGDLLFFINVRKANYNKYTSYTIINNHCFYIY